MACPQSSIRRQADARDPWRKLPVGASLIGEFWVRFGDPASNDEVEGDGRFLSSALDFYDRSNHSVLLLK